MVLAYFRLRVLPLKCFGAARQICPAWGSEMVRPLADLKTSCSGDNDSNPERIPNTRSYALPIGPRVVPFWAYLIGFYI